MSYDTRISEARPGQRNTIHLDFTDKTFEADMTVYFFEDSGHVINYIPALNLSSYGPTLEAARSMMIDDVLLDYFENLLNLAPAAAFAELSKHGWVIAGRDTSNFVNSAFVDRDGILRDFNLPQDTQIFEDVLTAA